MNITITQTVTIPDSIDPREVGTDMVLCALTQWYEYNDEGDFFHINEADVWTVTDPGEGKTITFTSEQFFEKHATLIWLATIENYRHDWIDFAFKSHEADPDEYDANTCDAVLQNMMYGEVVYG